MNVQPMLRTHPRVNGQANYTLVLATDACFDCAEACRACADASLDEEELDVLRNCIQMTLDCADVCFATGDLAIRRVLRTRDVMMRGTGFDERIMELMFETCAEVCHKCGAECMCYAEDHKHFRRCAEACRCCEQTCRNALRELKAH